MNSIPSGSYQSPFQGRNITIGEKLRELSRNLWWTWNPQGIVPFQSLDAALWRRVNHNPVRMLTELGPERIKSLDSNRNLHLHVDSAFRRLEHYMSSTTSWAMTHAAPLKARPVAYFSAEFGIHESIPTYSGGLGVLAGDHLKSASDLGLPMIGISLFYKEGYFKQRIDKDGQQHAEYIESTPTDLPVDLLLDAAGNPIVIELRTRADVIRFRAWAAHVGRSRLILLDTNLEENEPHIRAITGRLYGGDQANRIKQELVLGVGGVRLLRALGIETGAVHMNEGHSALAIIEMARHTVTNEGATFQDALEDAASRAVFTTHTPVPAGHDRFSADLIESHLGPMREQMGISLDALMDLGRVRTNDDNETFCMTVLALKHSRRVNGVSAIHARVSRKMWRDIWPGHSLNEIPIGHITNGVHVPSWLAWEMAGLYTRLFGENWTRELLNPDAWAKIYEVPDEELWNIHQILKVRLVEFARTRLRKQLERRGHTPQEVEACDCVLDPDVLTIGFARRFATYKRADLITQDYERFVRLVQRADRRVQFVFAGKAHPNDLPGQELIKKMVQLSNRAELRHGMVFIEDYDINVARHLVMGVDVWLNNPRRPLEASGTSGQKVVLNGGLNLSILDGWWPEGYDGQNGFAIDGYGIPAPNEIQDVRDRGALMSVLERDVIPLYYDNRAPGYPQGWVARMKRSIHTLGWRFNTDRMVADYALRCYLPAASAGTAEMP